MTGSPHDARQLDLDREIDALLAVEPSPQLVGRVREGIARDVRPVRSGLRLLALAGGAVVAVMLVAWSYWNATPMRPRAAAVAAATATAAPAPLVVETPTTPATGPAAPVRRPAPEVREPRPLRHAAGADPPVLIARDEQRSLQRVLRRAAQEPLHLAQRASDVMSYPVEPPAPIVVPAIVIEPLVPEAAEEGDSR